MASIFRRVYDWLLRLFWYVSYHPSSFALKPSIRRTSFYSPLLSNNFVIDTISISYQLTSRCAIQGYRNGYYDDRIAKCWKDLFVKSTGGKLISIHSPFLHLLLLRPFTLAQLLTIMLILRAENLHLSTNIPFLHIQNNIYTYLPIKSRP